MSYTYMFKNIIIGDTGVGKSCLLEQFTNKRFNEKYDATIGVEFGTKIISFDNLIIKLQIWDTTGYESFIAITRQYYRSAAGALLVYDVSKRESFQHISGWLEEAIRNGNQQLSFILVGNKCDLKFKRQVSYEEGEKFAKEHNLDFLEISAKTGYNVEESFKSIAKIIYDKIIQGLIDPNISTFGVEIKSESITSVITDLSQSPPKKFQGCY